MVFGDAIVVAGRFRSESGHSLDYITDPAGRVGSGFLGLWQRRAHAPARMGAQAARLRGLERRFSAPPRPDAQTRQPFHVTMLFPFEDHKTVQGLALSKSFAKIVQTLYNLLQRRRGSAIV